MWNYDQEVTPLLQSNIQWADYFYKLKELATTMFEWKGLPETVDQRKLEEYLFNRGFCFFFKDNVYGWLVLPGTANGLDVNGDPSMYWPISPVASFDAYTAENAVLIRNNYDRYPTAQTAYRYASALYDLDSTRDVNLQAQKTPYILAGEQSERRSLQTMFDKIRKNVPVMYTPKSLADIKEKIAVLKTEAPFIAPQLQDMKISILNEYLTFVGLSMATEKRERRVEGEIDQFDKQATVYANTLLKPRQEAAELMSNLYGSEITVDLASDVLPANPTAEYSGSYAYHYQGVNRESDDNG